MAFVENVALNASNIPRNTHQMLLQELHRQDREQALRVDRIGGRPVDQRVGASDQYMVLDSALASTSLSDPANGKFAFVLDPNSNSDDELVGVVNDLHTISEIEFQSFPMPNIEIQYVTNEPDPSPVVPAATNPCSEYITMGSLYRTGVDYSTLPLLYTVDTPAPILELPLPARIFYPSNNRFEIQVSETSVQSYSDRLGFYHNFSFDLIELHTQLYASPVAPVYVFTDPITQISILTLTFFDAYRARRLVFQPFVYCDVRIGITPETVNLPAGGIADINSLTFYVKTVKAALQVGDKFYVRKTLANKQPFNHEYLDDSLYNYMVGCDRDAPSQYALVVSKVTRYEINNNIFWGYEVNPFVGISITTNVSGGATNLLAATVDPAVVAGYGYTSFDPSRQIVVTVPNNDNGNANNIITCSRPGSFLFRYDTGANDKLKVDSSKIILKIDQFTGLPVGYQADALYHVQSINSDVRLNVAANTNAIMFTSANVVFDNPIINNDPMDIFRRESLLPTVSGICICIPKNHLRIPVRMRRVLRRITQLGGL